MRSEAQWREVSRCPQCGMPRYEMEGEYLDQCCCKDGEEEDEVDEH